MDSRLWFTVGSEQAGQRLDEALRNWLPGALSRSRIRTLILTGAVRVEDRPVWRPAWDLRPGVRVQVHLPPAAEPAPAPSFEASRILYEDEDLLAVDKPPGLPMHANLDHCRAHLVGLVEVFLEARDGVKPYLGIHQRLDRDTSGVVLFTRSRRANPGLARLFETRSLRKTYHALAGRPAQLPPRAWQETRPLGHPSRRGGPVPVLREGGMAAETRLRRLRTLARGLLVEACPLTGRKHQIRAHLAAEGLPILGDGLYGGPSRAGDLEVPRPMLHALRLELDHPVTSAPLVLESPYPDDFLQALAALGG